MRKLVLTVNEIRAEEGYQAMDGPLGDAPVNPSLIQPWLQFNQPPEAEGDPEQEGQQADTGQGPAPDPNASTAPQFGDEDRPPDFGKAFGLPPVFAVEEM